MLILHMNTLQTEFLFELLPSASTEVKKVSLIELAAREQLPLESVNAAITPFFESYTKALRTEEIAEGAGDAHQHDRFGFVVLSTSSVDGQYYLNEGSHVPRGQRGHRTIFVALGDWRKEMAPPSIVEFAATLLVSAVGFLLEGTDIKSRHFGSRGCIFDYTADLGDTRGKVLSGFICSDCTTLVKSHSSDSALAALQALAQRDWLVKPEGPLSPASTASALGYNLFVTKGLKPSVWERARTTLAEEGIKQVLTVIALVIGTAIVVWLGFKAS